MNIKPFCSALMLPIVTLSNVEIPCLATSRDLFTSQHGKNFDCHRRCLILRMHYLLNHRSCLACAVVTILFLFPLCTAINLFVMFPVHATPSTVFPKTSTIATTEPTITPTIIAVSNRVPYYYMFPIIY